MKWGRESVANIAWGIVLVALLALGALGTSLNLWVIIDELGKGG